MAGERILKPTDETKVVNERKRKTEQHFKLDLLKLHSQTARLRPLIVALFAHIVHVNC
jgi:hypothetical protein